MSFDVMKSPGFGSPAARIRTSASGRVQEVTMAQRSLGSAASSSNHPWQRHNVSDILNLRLFHKAILSFMIGVGQQVT